jgi:hypothetical protein
MESFGEEYSYQSFEDQMKNSDAVKKLRELIAKNIKAGHTVPMHINVTEIYDNNVEQFDGIISYVSGELGKIGWSIEYNLHEFDGLKKMEITLDKLSEDSCTLV